MIRWEIDKGLRIVYPTYVDQEYFVVIMRGEPYDEDGIAWMMYDAVGVKRWVKLQVDAVYGSGRNPIVDKNSKDYMWYSRYFKSVEKLSQGYYKVTVREPLDKSPSR